MTDPIGSWNLRTRSARSGTTPLHYTHSAMCATATQTVRHLFQRYCDAANGIATSATLTRNIDLPVLDAIDAGALTDTYLVLQASTMGTHLNALLRNIGNGQAIQDFYNTYAETRTYLRLKQSHPGLTPIPRQPNQTPDFALTLPQETIYLEYKSLNMVGGTAAQSTNLNQSLTANISLQDQARTGRRVRSATTVTQPYHATGFPYDPHSPRMVIETITRKIQSNLSPGQFGLGATLLLVDLAELPLVSRPQDSLNRTYIDTDTGLPISGELWHIAWGRLGTPIYKPSDAGVGTNEDEALTTEGILTAYPYVRGIIFLIGNDSYGTIEASQQPPHLVAFVQGITTHTRTAP
jgi:hypothetical protein